MLKKRLNMKTLYIFSVIFFCLIYNSVVAVKCGDLISDEVYSFEDGTTLYLDQVDKDLVYDYQYYTHFFPMEDDSKEYTRHYISGVLKHGDINIFTFNICIDLGSGSSYLANYNIETEKVSHKIFILSSEISHIKRHHQDEHDTETSCSPTCFKRKKTEDEIIDSPVINVYKVGNIILKVFRKNTSNNDYRGLLIYNKLSFNIPFRGFKKNFNGEFMRINLIRSLRKYDVSFSYGKEILFYIPKKNLSVVDKKDYGESYKHLNFPNYYYINECKFIYDQFINNNKELELYNNVKIIVNSIYEGLMIKGKVNYIISGEIFINGVKYEILSCHVEDLSSEIKYLDNGEKKIYNFNISDFLI